MWYVKGEWNGIKDCWWGAYQSIEDAEHVARLVNGMVFHESELH